MLNKQLESPVVQKAVMVAASAVLLGLATLAYHRFEFEISVDTPDAFPIPLGPQKLKFGVGKKQIDQSADALVMPKAVIKVTLS
jgi:hypothetical protein